MNLYVVFNVILGQQHFVRNWLLNKEGPQDQWHLVQLGHLQVEISSSLIFQ